MQQYDVRLKSILHRAMPQLFRMLGLPPVAEYLTIEFPVHQKILSDLVVRLTDGRILHLELQSKNDPRMRWRCLEYWRVIAELWPVVDILQVVIFLGEGPMTMESAIVRGRNQFGFDIVDLKQADAGDFLKSEADAERMLAVLCRSDDPRATIKAILASWKHLSYQEISEKVQDLFVLSQLRKQGRIVMEEATTMPIEIDLRDNELFKWGAQEGEVRGEARGEAKVLIKLLERRFGPLPESLPAKIHSANVETLDRWVDRLDNAPTLDAVFDQGI